MSDKSRAEFESFVSSKGLNTAVDDDLYRSQIVAWMWQAWLAATEKYEPSIKAYYYAVVAGSVIQLNARSGQLYIYETEVEAIAECPASCEVITIVATKATPKEVESEHNDRA